MLLLTNNRNIKDTKIPQPASFNKVKSLMNIELNKVKDYYHTRNSSVSNSNKLKLMIDYFSIDYRSDMDIVINMIVARKDAFIKHFGFASPYHTAKQYNNTIYGDTQEYFISTNDDIPLNIIKDWKTIKSIKVLYSDITTFKLPHPTLIKNNNINDKMMIYDIDIISMMLRYYFWCKERIQDDLSTNSAYFIYQYLMTDTIGDIYDHSIADLTFKIIDKGFFSETEFKNNPFPIRNFDNDILNVCEYFIKHSYKSKVSYSTLFKNIPTMFNENYFKLISPDMYFLNNKIRWFYLIIFINKLLVFINRFTKAKSVNTNMIGELKNQFKYLNNEHFDCSDDVLLDLEVAHIYIKDIS